MSDHDAPLFVEINGLAWAAKDSPEPLDKGALKGFAPYTFTLKDARWGDPIASQLSDLGERPLIIYPESFKLFGSTFWATRTDCRMKVIKHHYNALTGLVSIDMQPQDGVVTVRAEWWRRAIFHLGMPFVKLWHRLAPTQPISSDTTTR